MHVLVGYVIDGKSNGIDKYLLHMLDVMKQEDISFDFLPNHKTPELEAIFGAYHAGVIEMPSLKHPVGQYRFVNQLIQKEKYDVAYFNISEAFNAIGALAAHHAGVKKVIVHAHSSRVDSAITSVRLARTGIHKVFRPILAKAATDYCACSDYAGKWMFPEKIRRSCHYHVIHNAIDVSKFRYDEGVRNKVRDDLNLKDRVVVGHVGKYCYAKNNFFLLDIMDELIKKVPNAVLLSVGEGEDLDEMKKMAEERGLSNAIQFLGVREDVPALMQAMDFFVLPSRFEGQPIVAIEAQAAGLMTFLSNTITPEAVLGKDCVQLSIQSGGEIWARAIEQQLNYERNAQTDTLFKDSAYEESVQAEQLKKLFGA